MEQVEGTVAEGLRQLQVGAIKQVPTAAEVIDPGSELVEDILEELEIVRSIAETHNPAWDEGSGDEKEPEPHISKCEALQHLHALMRFKGAQAYVERSRSSSSATTSHL
ncbi:hypothetical protein BJ878DRAFT_481338 [Calycina marina]|uniref:Uncharacterized protein n=1 Tax=Calycina marina TaxID=1763456 RepID=A0A9P7Z0P3_9HELO|nr:hypothetical protein BJ878DRAFT_481338 [Calycina marina]